MSAGMFPSARPISQETWSKIRPSVLETLQRAGATDITPVGSIGHVNVAGDIDLAARHEGGKSGLESSLRASFETRKRFNQVSFLWPLEGNLGVQIDVFVGNPDYISWSRSHDP